MRHAAVLLLVATASVLASVDQSSPDQLCAVSPITRDSAPPDSNADPVGGDNPGNWYMNANRTIWAGPVPEGGWPAGGTLFSGHRATVKGQKTYWVRPQGMQLVISGRRIDASAPPLEANIPCCYPTGFQIVALHFPTGGCWEVTAKAGDHELRFVTQVNRLLRRSGR